jgi:hypothetical protein
MERGVFIIFVHFIGKIVKGIENKQGECYYFIVIATT